jgi:Tol biopolymer transport system component
LSDGEWILVTQRWFDEYGLGMSGLFQMRPDGTELQALTTGFDNVGTAILSPDKRWVAFSVGHNEQSDIYRMRLDGSSLEQLTYMDVSESLVEWLPDGKIVFITYGDGEAQMYRMQADGSAVEPLTFPHAGLRNPQWSPLIDLDWGRRIWE